MAGTKFHHFLKTEELDVSSLTFSFEFENVLLVYDWERAIGY